ncbi:hypothetical protein DMH04_05730 [Kibdelosporangium aridum]|uniref:Serine hydrolase n=1 Tax=Kibdelosporangium aridum TaxID=2030 RepID=A0A428ZN65_KIBAR|nr:hypothetical protein DMH04_05730 [Kibdelosporangium aridum]
MAAAVTAAATLGLIGCAATKAGPEPLQELPLQTGSAEQSQVPSDGPAPVNAPPGNPAPPKIPLEKLDVQQVVREFSRNAAAAAVVVDHDAGTTLISQDADRQFYAGSLVKLLVGVDAITRTASSAATRREVIRMIEVSDDDICSHFWVQNGGGQAIIGRMSKLMGLQATEPPKTRAGQWGDTLITANDVVRIYDYILNDAPSVVRMALLGGLTGAAKYGADGFNQYFGIPAVLKEHRWAIKQAWTDNDQAVSVHTTGLIGGGGDDWQYTVILLTEHPRPQTYDVATRSVTSAARAVSSLLEP